MLTRQQKRTLATVAKFVLPTIAIFLVVSAAMTAYAIHYITHPTGNKNYAATLKDYELLGIFIAQSEESWPLKNGGQGSGWLLRAATGAPLIVLSHGYEHNLADLLSLGVGLQRAGYHVLLYDIRGHGQSKVELTSLGEYETDDILSAIEHVKTLKDPDGNPLIDKDRIGLYGVSIGGYASLVAASKEPTVKAVVVDAVYPDVRRFVQIRIKQLSGLSNQLTDFLTDLGMKSFVSGKYGSTSALTAVRSYTDVKQLYILGKDAGDLLQSTSDVYNQALPFKETVEVPKSRINILYKNDQDVYDPVVVDFFRRPDVLPPMVTQTPALGAAASDQKSAETTKTASADAGKSATK
ncbi:MAG: alpha/beta fold hydrolase [Acidobacteriota bacterium]